MNKYDYGKNCFRIEKNPNGIKYFLKIHDEYIEIDKDVYKILKSSYDKIRYIYRQEVAKSVIYYEDIDSATFFISENNNSVKQVYIKELAKLVINEIALLPEPDKMIANCVFINDFSERETAKLLNIPKSTIAYRKKKLREIIKENVLFNNFVDFYTAKQP